MLDFKFFIKKSNRTDVIYDIRKALRTKNISEYFITHGLKPYKMNNLK